MEKSIFRPLPTQHLSQHDIKRNNINSSSANSFSQHLENELSINKKLIVSKHANERLAQRGINIDETRWKVIEEKVAKAKLMGVKDSLILLQDVALIVSAKNNTVITAIARDDAGKQIFTNINGTILIDT